MPAGKRGVIARWLRGLCAVVLLVPVAACSASGTDSSEATTSSGSGGMGGAGGASSSSSAGGMGGSGGEACDPAATELCNGIDDNCDGQIDEGDPEAGECDTGLDGICAKGEGHCEDGGIVCTQSDMPFDEVCDGLDSDCNGLIDDGNPGGGAACNTMLDGVCNGGTDTCVQGVVSCVPDVGPGEQQELCNDLDDDCDGLVDEGLAQQLYYQDSDGDGFGSESIFLLDCAQPMGYVPVTGDCNDAVGAIYPNAPELCNGIDDNCNGLADEGLLLDWYVDYDGDSWGTGSAIQACTDPTTPQLAYSDKTGDCSPFNASINPTASEVCNDLDDDCNGLVDDGLATTAIYLDNDGDGYAAGNAPLQQKCNVPLGWTAVDPAVDDDCDDTDITVYPTSPTVCDGKDNNCDGNIDRLCFQQCSGNWPFQLTNTQGSPRALTNVDLDGDGNHEALFQTDGAFAILDGQGNALYESNYTGLNYSRASAVVSDIDQYNAFGVSTQTLEVLTGNGSQARFYKLNADSSVTLYENTGSDGYVYDASRFMVADIDHDGQPEFVTSTWCQPDGTKFYRFDTATNAINLAGAIPDSDGVCQYTDGRVLTDLDGDGTAEMVIGNGYASPVSVVNWSGKLYAYSFSNPATLTTTSYCNNCFDTALAGFEGGGAVNLLRIGDELRAQVVYFDQPVANSPSHSEFWAFDIMGTALAGSPTTSNLIYANNTDLDADGVAESVTSVATQALVDLNGDGYPDRVARSGTSLLVQLYNPQNGNFVTETGASKNISSSAITVGSVWDMAGINRARVLAYDASGNAHCYQLGDDTWDRDYVLPPHLPLHQRTYQWDNYEPNEGVDDDADGVPDQLIRIPSALTANGEMYGYLSHAGDADAFMLNTNYSGNLCVTAPLGKAYNLKVYSYADKVPVDGQSDGLVWENGCDVNNAGCTPNPTARQKCFAGSQTVPTRYGEYRFVVVIEKGPAADDFTPYWPYWINAPK